MYALENGLGMRWLGVLFALFTVLASFGIGNMVQANSISTMAASNFGVSTQVTGIVLMLITAAVILGGLQSIAKVCEVLVPFMADRLHRRLQRDPLSAARSCSGRRSS